MATHQHGLGADEVGLLRVNVQGLVSLHEPPGLALRIRHHEHHCAVALDGGAAHGGDAGGEHPQALAGPFVGRHGAVADDPGGFEFGVPNL